jgi:hypothetical protein
MTKNTKVLVKHILAVLKMPAKIGDKIIKAQFIQSKLTGNANFPVPYPANIVALAQLGTDITALVTAQIAAQSRTVGSSDARDAALNTVLIDLRSILSDWKYLHCFEIANLELNLLFVPVVVYCYFCCA